MSIRLALGDAPATAPSTAIAPSSAAPAGYWVNPNNPTQWLPPDQGAQVGKICFFGTGLLPGRIRVGGNGPNSKCYCGSLFDSPATDSMVFYGGGAVLAYLLLPDRYKWWVAIPLAGLAVVGTIFSPSK